MRRSDPNLGSNSARASAAALLVLVGGCRSDSVAASGGRAASAPFDAPRVAELYFTTGLEGTIEPCGCTTKPLGGLPKLATVIGRSPAPSALVDAGQLLLPTEGLDPITRPQHLAKAALIARAFRKLGVAAINLAPSDLQEGTGLLEDLQREGAVPLVSANVRPREERGPEIARSYVRVVGSIRFGITGIAIPEQIQAQTRDLAALEFAPALASEVASLREAGAEIIVVLAHLPEADARILAEAVPAVDLMIRSPGTAIERPPTPPVRVGPVIIAEAGRKGQHVGRARFLLDRGEPPRPLPLDDAGARQAAERARLERKIAALARDIERFRHEPGMAAAVASRARVKASLEARLSAPEPSAEGARGPRVEITIVSLSPEVPDHEAMEKLLAAYDQKLRAMNLERGDPAECTPRSAEAPRFVGNQACMDCHPEAYAFWRRTKHAEAWATLQREAKHYDLTCVGCHSVGFRSPGGFCRLKESGPYRDVGCESCHGPGSRHAAEPLPGTIDRGGRSETCTAGCHVPEHSDAFVYESYVRRVTGPGHPRAGGEGR